MAAWLANHAHAIRPENRRDARLYLRAAMVLTIEEEQRRLSIIQELAQ